MRLTAINVCLAVGAVSTGVSGASASVVTLNPVADSMVDSALPGNNYGGAGSVAVSAPGLGNGEFQSVLRFDTSSAAAAFDGTYGAGQWTITSITLKLTAAAPNNAIFNSPSAAGQFAASWMVNDSWVEGTGTPAAPGGTGITFSTLASFLSGGDEALGTLAYNGATSGATTYSLGLTPGIVADAGAGGLVSLRLSAVGTTIAGVWTSRSFGTVSARPELAITATPSPSSALGVVGMAMLASMRRRRAD